MKRRLSILMALALLLSSVTGATVLAVEHEGYTLPLCAPGEVTLSLAGNDNGYAPVSFTTNPGIFAIFEEKTGVKIDWQVAASDYATVINTRLAAGADLPDMFIVPGGNSTDSLVKLAEQGLILPIDTYIERYATNVLSFYEKFPDLRSGTTHEDGHIYSFAYSVHEQRLLKLPSPNIRLDWLNKLGLEKPVTLDDWVTVLTAFKEQDPNGNGLADEIPLACPNLQVNEGGGYGVFANAWGLRYGSASMGKLVREDGSVGYSQIEPAFKEYLTWMNKLYSEGLIDPQLFPALNPLLDSNVLGASVNMTGALPTQNARLVQAGAVDAMLVPILPPVLEAGDQPVLEVCNGIVQFFAISKDCKHPDIAVQWIDYMYASEEGRRMSNWGVEGVTFEFQDGQPRFTELVTSNPDGLDMASVVRSQGGFNGFLMIRDINFMRALSQPYEVEYSEAVQEYLSDPFPPVVATAEEAMRISSILADARPFEEETIARFIMGQEPLENFDNYIEQMKALGIEEAIAIWQAQYDRSK